MKSFKQHIFEKLKVTSKSTIERKEYKNKTKQIHNHTAHTYRNYILVLDSMDLFMDFWYYYLEHDDEGIKEKLDLHWDDIYIDYDNHNVYILDNNTDDEIIRSSYNDPKMFYNVYNRIIEYFEKKNS